VKILELSNYITPI